MTLDEEKKAKLPDGIKIYELITVNFLRRWFGIWDFLFCVLQYYVYLNTNPFKNYKTLGLLDSLNTVFYKIRLFFSRYSFVNTLKRIK